MTRSPISNAVLQVWIERRRINGGGDEWSADAPICLLTKIYLIYYKNYF